MDAPPSSTTRGPEYDRARKKQMAVLKLSSQELSKAIDSVKQESIDGLMKTTIEIDIGSTDMLIFAIFEFQGFDPYAIMRKLIALKNQYGFTDDDLKVDIMYIIAANIYMGNLSGKSYSRRGSEGRDVVDELSARYQMQLGTTGTGLSSDILTFPRVAGSFPVLSCRMANRLPTKDHVGEPFKSVPVPKFMRMNAFASFCPPKLAERTRLFLLKANAAYSCDQSIVFLRGQKKKEKVKPEDIKIEPALVAADQWTFIWAASEGPVPPMEARRKLHTELNTFSLYNQLHPVVENYDTVVGDSTARPTKEEYEKDISDFISGV